MDVTNIIDVMKDESFNPVITPAGNGAKIVIEVTIQEYISLMKAWNHSVKNKNRAKTRAQELAAERKKTEIL